METKQLGYDVALSQGACVYEGTCPLVYALAIIGGKWKLPVLWHLFDKKRVRYNDLKRSVVGVTNMMLSKCLKELEKDQLVLRTQYNEVPPRVEYELTERGRLLLPALEALYTWGAEQAALPARREEAKG